MEKAGKKQMKSNAGSYRLRSDSSAAATGVGIHVVEKYIPTKEPHGSERILQQDCGGVVIVLGTEIMEEAR